MQMNIERTHWGTVPGQGEVYLFTLFHGDMTVSFINYGARLVRLMVPGRQGPGEVTLGFDSLDAYLRDEASLGAVVGRVAGRISNACFKLEGRMHELDRNHGRHTIHGGAQGFGSRVWEAEGGVGTEGPYLACEYLSRDGEQGFPGMLTSTVIYTLTENGLRMNFLAEAGKPTVVNLTNHAYFNLAGPRGDCLGHELEFQASRCLDMDGELIPSGRLVDIRSTPLDFTHPTAMGARIEEDDAFLALGSGYDHFFVANGNEAGLKLLARVHEPVSGRSMEMHTTYPGFQFYSGNHLREGLPGRKGETYAPRSGFCLEAQGYPDAPNRPEFPSIALEPGRVSRQKTEYRFFVE